MRSAELRDKMGSTMTKGIGVWRDTNSINFAIEGMKNVRGQLSNVYVENKGKVFNTDLTSYLELEFSDSDFLSSVFFTSSLISYHPFF